MSKTIHVQDLINEEAKKFIKELNGREFTLGDYRNILFGNCSNILKSKAKQDALTDYVNNPSVQLRGVGNNGVIMNKHMDEADEEVKMWKNQAIKLINNNT